jgi:hypothetical protein
VPCLAIILVVLFLLLRLAPGDAGDGPAGAVGRGDGALDSCASSSACTTSR